MARNRMPPHIRGGMRTFRSFGRSFTRTIARSAAMSLLCAASSALAIGCSDSGSGPSAPSAPNAPSSAPAPPSDPAPQYNAGLAVVPLLTYDGSGQAVHPDIATTPLGWSDATTHVVATPYPGGQTRFENPSYYDVLSTSAWLTPASATNPVAMPTPGAYLSDPDMVYDPDTRLLSVYYREVTDSNLIEVIRSADGVRWSAPVTVVSVPRHLAVSPTVVRRSAREWLMWSVNAGAAGCTAPATTVELRRSTDGLAWSDPETVQLGYGGATPWHIDVEWIPSRHEYWGVYNAKTPGSCMTEVLRFATSPDGVTWTEFPSPLLRAGAIPEFADVVYRASIAYDPATDVVTLLYSGARSDNGAYVWEVATEQLPLATLMSRITAAPAPTPSHKHSHLPHAGHTHRPDPSRAPPLTNETAP
jgi:hypothetical protein